MKVRFQRTNEDATIPTKNNPTDAGWDVYACEDVTIHPQTRRLVKTGLIYEPIGVPEGYLFEIQVRPRSGMALKQGMTILNSPGTVDQMYRNEIGVIAYNASEKEIIYIKKGDRVAQFVFHLIENDFEVEEGEVNTDAHRGGGFGSSGR